MKRRAIPVALAGTALLVGAATASANPAVNIMCPEAAVDGQAHVFIDLVNFPPNVPVTVPWSLTISDGRTWVGREAFIERTDQPINVTVPNATWPMTATVEATYGGKTYRDARTVTCPSIVLPPEEPAPVVSEPTPVPPVRPPKRTKPRPRPENPYHVTCADLRRLGAGKKWYVKLKCVRPNPHKPKFGPNNPFRGVAG